MRQNVCCNFLFDLLAGLRYLIGNDTLSPMPDVTDPTPPPPELIVLEALKLECEMVRKHNADPEIAQAALDWETKFAARIAKITPEARPATVTMAA